MVVKYRPYHFEDSRGFEQGIGNILFPLAEKEIGRKFNWIFLLAYSKTSFQFLFPQKDAKCKVAYEQEAISSLSLSMLVCWEWKSYFDIKLHSHERQQKDLRVAEMDRKYTMEYHSLW